MAKKYIEQISVPIGVGKEISIKKNVDNGSIVFYMIVDEKFFNEFYQSKRLSPSEAEKIITNEGENVFRLSSNRDMETISVTDILQKYFGG